MRYLIPLFALLLLTACTQQFEETNELEHLAPDAEASELKEFDVNIYNHDFDQHIITVNKGDTVRLMLTAEDGDYGVMLEDFGVYTEKIKKGDTVEVEFVADKEGTFSFFCNAYCNVTKEKVVEGYLEVLS
jgi:heme/copper-type cytochrome/quinol oxidase subunit 2